MSATVKVIMPESGFVSWMDDNDVRQETFVSCNDEYPADAPIVRARPDVFSAPPPAAARRGQEKA